MKIYRTVCFASLLLVHSLAHATSFDCSKGRSVTEQMICHHADLSKLDDQLGKLYWQARRRVSNPKAFRADSDSKWAWREANCSDEACLNTWYNGRIAELRELLAGLQQDRSGVPLQAAPRPRDIPAEPETPVERGELAQARQAARQAASAQAKPDVKTPALPETTVQEAARTRADAPSDVKTEASTEAKPEIALIAHECTAADPGIVLHEQCNTVLKQDARWSYATRNGDWFCGIATVGQAPAAQEASVQEPTAGLRPEATP